ncbi:MAG: HD domain-containing protein [Candidatus Thermoplasmatota archaeon]|nr:HD domain-containing protein [Candidatus Thermoplasmatota archaeon]
MDKLQFIKDLKQGDKVSSLFAVKFKKPIREYVNGYMFEMRVADKTGELTAKYWSDRNIAELQTLYESFQKGDVIHVTGMVNEYLGNLEIGISKAEGNKIVKQRTFELKDFVESVAKNLDEMLIELGYLIKSLKDSNLKLLLESVFKDEKFVSKFKIMPASMMYHQNKLGGLLEHTLNVAKLCEAISSIHPALDRDLLIAGALLHDVGKVFELEVTTVIDVTEEGMLRGHTVLGEEFVLDKIKKMPNFPDLLKLKIAHLVLAHHGELEFGAVKKPQLPEAVALHYADYCDAKVDIYLREKEEARTEDLWIWSKLIKGHVYLK